MQLALPSPMPDASPAVFAVNGEKPHQGVTGKNPGLHQGLLVSNSTTALGVSWRQWSGTVPGARVTYEYDAYGNLLNKTGSTPNNYLYRGEQWDADLGLYYLRARYYNPITGRFMSRDPYDGNNILPILLHKYLYAGSNPVKYVDPSGRDLFEYEIRSNAAIPEAKLIDIYGCVANASLAAADLILGQINPNDTTANLGTASGGISAVFGCVTLVPGLNDLAEQGVEIAKTARGTLQFISTATGWGHVGRMQKILSTASIAYYWEVQMRTKLVSLLKIWEAAWAMR